MIRSNTRPGLIEQLQELKDTIPKIEGAGRSNLMNYYRIFNNVKIAENAYRKIFPGFSPDYSVLRS